MAKTMKVPIIMFEYFMPSGKLSKEELKSTNDFNEKIGKWWELTESNYTLMVEVIQPYDKSKYEISFYGPKEEDLLSAGHDLIEICGMPPYMSSSKKDLLSRLVTPYKKKLKGHLGPSKGLKVIDA